MWNTAVAEGLNGQAGCQQCFSSRQKEKIISHHLASSQPHSGSMLRLTVVYETKQNEICTLRNLHFAKSVICEICSLRNLQFAKSAVCEISR